MCHSTQREEVVFDNEGKFRVITRSIHEGGTVGQAMNDAQRELVSRHPNVYCVTQTHIVLKDGTVLDPDDFHVRDMRVVLINKLLRCGCDQYHPAGLHIFMETTG